MSTPESTPPRAAASVVILRDGRDGIEVFMLRRHRGQGVAFSGATVFPGGKVDPEDDDAEHVRQAPAPAGHPPHSFWVAAVRETFEEAGLLIARRSGAAGLIGAEEAARLVADERRRASAGGATRLADLLARQGLIPALDRLIHFGHWITPASEQRRFDTHFFLLAAPIEQQGAFDGGESAEGGWLSPSQVLCEAEAGTRTLVAVTRFSLELILTWRTVAEAIAGALERRVVTVLPHSEPVAEGRILRVPKEAGYPRHELLIRRP